MFALALSLPSSIVILVPFKADLCDEANCDLVGFPLFCRHLGFFLGSWSPNSRFVLFDPKWPGECLTPLVLTPR